MIWHCRFVSCNNWTTLMLIMGEAVHVGGAWNVSELSETSLQFSCEVKTAQKKKKFLTLKIRETWVNQQKSHSIKVSQRLKEKKKKSCGKSWMAGEWGSRVQF